MCIRWPIGCCLDRSPGDLSDDEDVRDYQDFSSNDDLSDVDAGDDRPTQLRKLHATRSNFSSQVCYQVKIIMQSVNKHSVHKM